MRIVIILTLALVGTFSSHLRADHNDPHGSVGRLYSEARQLDQDVNYSNINPAVKNAVRRFMYDVQRLSDCVEFHRNEFTLEDGAADDHTTDDHTGAVGCPARCQSYLNYARSSFQECERYLYDTQYDYPRIYQSYLEVRSAIHAIHVQPGPGPLPTNKFRCVAVDKGWEEHSGGHVGFAYYLDKAQQQALYECRRYHGSCRISRCENVN